METLITVNILEGLRFYVSFVVVLAFGELKLLEGFNKDYFIYRKRRKSTSNSFTKNYKQL